MSGEIRPRRTKIVCTLGPASNTPELIEALVRAGLDVARLNFSHGTHEDHRKVYQHVRTAEARLNKPIAVLQDLSGPKIRLGMIDGEVLLEPGEMVTLSPSDDFSGTKDRLPTTYNRLARDVRPGERVLLADGRIELCAESIERGELSIIRPGGKVPCVTWMVYGGTPPITSEAR